MNKKDKKTTAAITITLIGLYQYFDNCAGFVAFSSGGDLLCFSRNILDLQSQLHSILPEMVEEHEDILSEGGTWFCLIDYLLVSGLQVYIATDAAMKSLECNDLFAKLQHSCDTRQIWISGEKQSCHFFSVQEFNISLSDYAMDTELKQSLGSSNSEMSY